MKNTIQKDNTVCVLGLGYVGLTLATVLSDVGFVIFGVDKNKFGGLDIQKTDEYDDFHSVHYTELIPHLVNYIKELYDFLINLWNSYTELHNLSREL